jgi:hypothetical protein
MRKPQECVLIALASLALAIGGASLATAQVPPTFEDGEFQDADWQLTVFTIGGGGTVQVERRATGGNPDAFRLMQHENGTGGGAARNRVVGVHRNLAANHDPGTDGAIPCLDYAEDARLYAGGGDGQST